MPSKARTATRVADMAVLREQWPYYIEYCLSGHCSIGAVNSKMDPSHTRDGIHERSEEHTSELQSLMRNSYAVVCLKKTKPHRPNHAGSKKQTTTPRNNN